MEPASFILSTRSARYLEISFNLRQSVDSLLGGCTLPYSEAATIGRSHRYSGGCIAHADFALDASPHPPLPFLAVSFQSRGSICLVMCAGIPDQPSTAQQTFNVKIQRVRHTLS